MQMELNLKVLLERISHIKRKVNIRTRNIIKSSLSLLFFLCLTDMPYGYYQLVRFLALVGFLVLAYSSFKNNKIEIAILYVVLAILFQPFFKVTLGREIWNLVDVIVGCWLLIDVFLSIIYSKNNSSFDSETENILRNKK